MLDFVARMFRSWMNGILWITLIGSIVSGFIVGGNIAGGRGFNGGYAFLGLIIGGIIGFVSIILGGGLIANFLNMVDNMDLIKKHLIGNSTSPNPISTSSSNNQLNNISPQVAPKINFGDTWTCKKCNERNSINSTFCKTCGTYK